MTSTKHLTLYGYWRSSASYRVRIAMGLKGLQAEMISVNLKDGDQFSDRHSARNPQSFVPVLELQDGTLLTQSGAIIEYLDEVYPDVPLLPAGAIERAKVRAVSSIIGSDTAPIQNLRVLKHIQTQFDATADQTKRWVQNWISNGLSSIETLLSQEGLRTPFLMGDRPGYFECFLVPQIYNARRWGVDVANFPMTVKIEQNCAKLDAFISALPENQSDAS